MVNLHPIDRFNGSDAHRSRHDDGRRSCCLCSSAAPNDPGVSWRAEASQSLGVVLMISLKFDLLGDPWVMFCDLLLMFDEFG